MGDINQADIGDPVLLFQNDLSYGCNVKMDLDELRTACASGGSFASIVDNYAIFRDLSFIGYFGKFGDSDFHNTDVSAQLLFSLCFLTFFCTRTGNSWNRTQATRR